MGWYAPTSGSVDHYLLSIRELSRMNVTSGPLYLNRKKMYTTTYTFVGISDCSVYRAAVAAVDASGKEKWTEIVFFVGRYNKYKNDETISFKIWNDFETETKNAIYYATQAWNNAVGDEIVNTYAFSNGYSKNSMTKDNVNAVTGVSVGTGKYLMATVVYIDDDVDPWTAIEVDININKDHPWYNGSRSGYFDVQNSMTHDMGHAIGLSHKYEDFALDWSMYGNSSTGEIKKRSLHQQDIKNAQQFHIRAKE